MQQKYCLRKYQNERGEARRLQRSGSSRRTKKEADSQNPFSSGACRLSTVDHVEEITLEPPKKRQEMHEVTSETAWKATRGRGEDARRLEPEGETEMPETRVVADGVKESARGP